MFDKVSNLDIGMAASGGTGNRKEVSLFAGRRFSVSSGNDSIRSKEAMVTL